MRVDEVLFGVIVIDISSPVGGAEGENRHNPKAEQEQALQEGARTPVFQQEHQPAQASEAAKPSQKKRAGGLQLRQVFAREGRHRTKQRAKQVAKSEQEHQAEQHHQPSFAAPHSFPVDMLDQVAQRPAAGKNHRHGNVGGQPGHAFAGIRKGQQAHQRPIDEQRGGGQPVGASMGFGRQAEQALEPNGARGGRPGLGELGWLSVGLEVFRNGRLRRMR